MEGRGGEGSGGASHEGDIQLDPRVCDFVWHDSVSRHKHDKTRQDKTKQVLALPVRGLIGENKFIYFL